MLWMTMRINKQWLLKIVGKEKIGQNENMQRSIIVFAYWTKGFWTYSSHTWSCETCWVHMDFCAKNQIKNDEIVRYKAQLVAQGCSQNLVLICEKTYSLVLDATTLQYSIILVAQQGLHLHLMDDVTTYSYDSFENHIWSCIYLKGKILFEIRNWVFK